MYAIAYVPEEVADTGVSRRGPAAPRADLFAVSITHRAPEHHQRRIQRQPATGLHTRTATNETAVGRGSCSNARSDWQHPLASSRRRARETFCQRQAFAS